MSAQDDYPCLDEGSSIHDWDEQYGRMCDEIDRLRAEIDSLWRVVIPVADPFMQGHD